MPDRDKKGPRARSPRPSKTLGGLKRGGCKPIKRRRLKKISLPGNRGGRLRRVK